MCPVAACVGPVEFTPTRVCVCPRAGADVTPQLQALVAHIAPHFPFGVDASDALAVRACPRCRRVSMIAPPPRVCVFVTWARTQASVITLNTDACCLLVAAGADAHVDAICGCERPPLPPPPPLTCDRGTHAGSCAAPLPLRSCSGRAL